VQLQHQDFFELQSTKLIISFWKNIIMQEKQRVPAYYHGGKIHATEKLRFTLIIAFVGSTRGFIYSKNQRYISLKEKVKLIYFQINRWYFVV